MEQELEFILRDILDDLKALRVSNAERESESLNIANRLNTFEKLLKEQQQSAPVLNTNPIENVISKELFKLRNYITTQNANKYIEHKHHLHKGLFASLILTLLCIILSIGWYRSYDISKQLKANDIKYRALKIAGDKSILKLLHYTDSLYLINSDSFKARIDEEEKHIEVSSNH